VKKLTKYLLLEATLERPTPCPLTPRPGIFQLSVRQWLFPQLQLGLRLVERMDGAAVLQHEHADGLGLPLVQVSPLAELLPLAAAGAVVEMLLARRHHAHLAVGGNFKTLLRTRVRLELLATLYTQPGLALPESLRDIPDVSLFSRNNSFALHSTLFWKFATTMCCLGCILYLQDFQLFSKKSFNARFSTFTEPIQPNINFSYSTFKTFLC